MGKARRTPRRRKRRPSSRVTPTRARLADAEWAAYQAHPQNWFAAHEFEALVRIVMAREPRLLTWFAAKRTALLTELKADLAQNIDVPVSLLRWCKKLEHLQAPVRITPGGKEREALRMWAALYHYYLIEALHPYWKHGKLAVGVNVLIANKLPRIFRHLDQQEALQKIDEKFLRHLALSKSLDGFVTALVGKLVRKRPAYVRREIARARADYGRALASSGEPLDIPYLIPPRARPGR